MSFTDLHIHGAFGVDLLTASAADLDRLAAKLAGHGYDSFLPTLIPLGLDQLEPLVERLGHWMASRSPGDGRGALPLGIHFEGPFLSPSRSGALDPQRFLDGRDPVRVNRFTRLLEQLPGRHMITLAPEIEGGLELVREFRGRGMLVSIGHTDADFATLEQAADAGARHMTHFCNAMRPFHHREPGPIAFGLLHDEISVDLIADLHHLHPATLRLILRTKPADRLVLISDAMPATGLGDGVYPIWGESLTVRDGMARNQAGALAGSVILLDQAIDNLIGLGYPVESARTWASSNARDLLRDPAGG